MKHIETQLNMLLFSTFAMQKIFYRYNLIDQQKH